MIVAEEKYLAARFGRTDGFFQRDKPTLTNCAGTVVLGSIYNWRRLGRYWMDLARMFPRAFALLTGCLIASYTLTDKQAEYLDYVTKSTNALLALTNNILDLATIDAGAMKLELGPVNIEKAIQDAAEGIQDRLAESLHCAALSLVERRFGSAGRRLALAGAAVAVNGYFLFIP